jgi:hypothetical protein
MISILVGVGLLGWVRRKSRGIRRTLTGGELVRGTVNVLGIGEPGVISRAELKVKFG